MRGELYKICGLYFTNRIQIWLVSCPKYAYAVLEYACAVLEHVYAALEHA